MAQTTTNSNGNVFANVKQSIKAAVGTIDKQIKALEAQKRSLLNALGTPAAATPTTKTAGPKAAKAAKAGGARPTGMLNVLLPFMEGKPQVTAADLLKQLHTDAAYKDAKANSLYATLANEVKKPNARIERVGDGVYRVTAAYFNRPTPATVAATAEPQSVTA